MKPIKFDDRCLLLKSVGSKHEALPAVIMPFDSRAVQVVSAWKLSQDELIALKLTGMIYVSQIICDTISPMALSIDAEDFVQSVDNAAVSYGGDEME